MTHILLGDKLHFSAVLPQAASFKSYNDWFALSFYHKSTLYFLFNTNTAWITQARQCHCLLETSYIYLFPGGLSGKTYIAYPKMTSLGLLSLLTNCSWPLWIMNLHSQILIHTTNTTYHAHIFSHTLGHHGLTAFFRNYSWNTRKHH